MVSFHIRWDSAVQSVRSKKWGICERRLRVRRTMKNQRIYISAIFPNPDSARRAARALRNQGVDRSRIILVDGGEEFEKPAKVKFGSGHRKEFAQVSDDGLAKGAAIGGFGGCLIIRRCSEPPPAKAWNDLTRLLYFGRQQAKPGSGRHRQHLGLQQRCLENEG